MISPRTPLGKPRDTSSRDLSYQDVLIVGSGVAGLSAALELARAEPEVRVTLLTRGQIGALGASPLAQGGIAAALGPDDSPFLHADDTELAGGRLGSRDLIEVLTEQGLERVRELARLGAAFDREPSGDWSLGLEGAHSRPRIIHAHGDQTGREVSRALSEAVRGERVAIAEHARVLDLFAPDGRVLGVWARDQHGRTSLFRASATILATGGAGRVYLRTTSPSGLEGDGLAMAARAGARLRDLEFMQFHPTALNVSADPLPLITEALRGAGARIVDRSGERVLGPHEGDDLASRDRVARAIWQRMQDGVDVFLDARQVFDGAAGSHFPGVRRLCGRYGIDPTSELIPVCPAAHYHMGGIAVDGHGRSSLEGLWAIGEAAASGVHGANRLASNSLLEGLVFGPRAARSAVQSLSTPPEKLRSEERAAIHEAPRHGRDLPDRLTHRIRTIMWNHVGVVRAAEGLSEGIRQLELLEERLGDGVPPWAQNLLLCARMIARAAELRKESLGGHFRSDAPEGEAPRPRHSQVTLSREAQGGIHAVLEVPVESSRRDTPTRMKQPSLTRSPS